MTGTSQFLSRHPLFRHRLATHACFWLLYYLLFSLIWATPERGYYASFYLEFVLMPLRILASYCMMYMLIPAFLSHRKIVVFVVNYLVLIIAAGGLQLLIAHYFYDQLLSDQGERFPLSVSAWARNIVLINTTVILLGAAKVFKLHFELLDALAYENEPAQDSSGASESDEFLEVKSNRRIHRLRISEILYVEGMGNYISYVNKEGERTIVYSSLKAAEAKLPDSFIRLHRSYLVNRSHISAYDKDTVTVGPKTIPRGKNINDELLKGEE